MIKPAHQQFAEKLVQLLIWEAGHNGFSSSDLADQVGGSPRTYENYRYEAIPTLAGFLGILRITKPQEVARKIAQQCGGYFVKITNHNKPSPIALSKQTAEIMKETADVINAVADTLRDSRISEAERKRVIREIDEAIEALLRARMSLEE